MWWYRRSAAARILPFVTGALIGCGRGGDDAAVVEGGFVESDSAGVVIAGNGPPAWTAGSGWRLAATPELEVGVANGPVEYVFGSIAGAAYRSDGRLIVADDNASEIRLYEPDGTFVRSAGGRGDGPGEFRLINAIGIGSGDTAWVYDFGLRRFTLLDPELRVVRTVPVKADLGALLAVGMTMDGEFVVREAWSSRAPAGAIVTGLRRDSAAIVRLDVEGGIGNTITMLPAREVVISSENGRSVMSAPVVARNVSAALARGAVVLGDQSDYEIRVYALDGKLRRILRRSGVNLELSPRDLEAAMDARLADLPAAERPAARLALEAMPNPGTRPAYSALHVDPDGNIWAGAWMATGEPPDTWSVFDGVGRYLGDVAMPAGFRPLSWWNDRVAGVWHDDLGVERIRVYRIEHR